MLLQSYICPLAMYNMNDEGVADLGQLIGTIFFVNEDGIFLTAKHVIESAISLSEERGMSIGVVVKDSNNASNSLIAPLVNYEFYSDNIDICVGKIDYFTPTELFFTRNKIAGFFSDVITFGYPIDAVHKNVFYEDRALKGYIQREIDADKDNSLGNSGCASYEVNFVVSRGMSGSPLIKVNSDGKFIVVGICVGFNRSHTIDFERTEVNDNGDIFVESVQKIIEYSRAPMIQEFLEWKPNILNGKSLMECCQHKFEV